MRCINCGIDTRRLRRYEVSSLPSIILTILAQWLLPFEVRNDDNICNPCYILLNSPQARVTRLYGHSMVCIGCGRSLRNSADTHLIENDSPLLPYLSIMQHTLIQDSNYACFTCWVRSRRQQRQDQMRLIENPSPQIPTNELPLIPNAPLMPPTPRTPGSNRSSDVIRLPNYKRASNVSTHCIYRGCANHHLHLVPGFIKQLLLNQHNLYVPRSCRVCENHLFLNEWQNLPDNINTFNTFNAIQIEDLIRLKSKASSFNFENVHEMPNVFCHYWTGLTVINFLTLFSSLPPLNIRKPKNALAIYLAKLRTGETDRRLSTLFSINRATLYHYFKIVRTWLSEHLVPSYIGPNHITHEEIVNRNLSIPNALFGAPNPLGNRPAIAIFDGTYVYLQKSTNYLFQKKSYSLHKYDNLVKPFVIVSTDGHIIDVVGPFAATQTDAEIMCSLFENNDSPYRRLFNDNDVFILDRGFRDAIPLLETLNYQIQKPETLLEGHNQLTYMQANKSRRVTLCRWVVEIVNGRFKRDFKIFRQRFFNLASNHLMQDFKIAAALINKFHPVLEDGPNAGQIIERVNRFMNEPNHVGIYVNENNLNRRRAIFLRVDGNLPQLADFPLFSYSELLLVSLGPYQIKQARSYYGEHIRANGVYHVEVCPELENTLASETGVGGIQPKFLRGRIKSRHISQRVYYTYIVYEGQPTNENPLDAILGYYCSCIVGNRTVGCCCHVMTIIWYLGWARHQQDTPTPPASFLDGILVRINE